jgi:hypothetical protein
MRTQGHDLIRVASDSEQASSQPKNHHQHQRQTVKHPP